MKLWDNYLRYLFEEVGSAAQQRVFKIKLTMEQLTQFSEKCPWQKISSERTVHLLYRTRSYTQHVASTIHIGTCLLLHIPDITGKIYLRKVSTIQRVTHRHRRPLIMDHKSHKSTQRKVQVLVKKRGAVGNNVRCSLLCSLYALSTFYDLLFMIACTALYNAVATYFSFTAQHTWLISWRKYKLDTIFSLQHNRPPDLVLAPGFRLPRTQMF